MYACTRCGQPIMWLSTFRDWVHICTGARWCADGRRAFTLRALWPSLPMLRPARGDVASHWSVPVRVRAISQARSQIRAILRADSGT
jgi:hypothetical protein